MNAPYFRETQVAPELKQQCGQANVNGTKLRNMLNPLPPVAEQHRIVARSTSSWPSATASTHSSPPPEPKAAPPRSRPPPSPHASCLTKGPPPCHRLRRATVREHADCDRGVRTEAGRHLSHGDHTRPDQGIIQTTMGIEDPLRPRSGPAQRRTVLQMRPSGESLRVPRRAQEGHRVQDGAGVQRSPNPSLKESEIEVIALADHYKVKTGEGLRKAAEAAGLSSSLASRPARRRACTSSASSSAIVTQKA